MSGVGAPVIRASPRSVPSTKVVAASAFGTIVEWYDFFIYRTAAALVFGKLFVPAAHPLVSTLAAFGVDAAGYLARSLGGITP